MKISFCLFFICFFSCLSYFFGVYASSDVEAAQVVSNCDSSPDFQSDHLSDLANKDNDAVGEQSTYIETSVDSGVISELPEKIDDQVLEREMWLRSSILGDLEKAKNYAMNDSGEPYSEFVLSEFSSEEVDANWSSDYREKIESFFSESLVLEDINPYDVECRESRCRLAFSISSEQELERMSSVLLREISERGKIFGLSQRALSAPDVRNNEWSVYWSRNE